MSRTGSATQLAYDVEKDFEYNESLLISILMICGYDEYNPEDYSIDEVIIQIRNIFSYSSESLLDDSKKYLKSISSSLVTDYRRCWYNRQLIKAAQ